MTTTLSLGQIVIDSVDAAALAGFWSRLLQRPTLDGANRFFAVVPPADDRAFPALMFLAVPEPRSGKNRLHLDLVSADRPAAVERAVQLGARKVGDFDEYGTQWTTLADPEGNVFDIGIPHSDQES
jgi:Glyoxalase-like domain